MIGETRSKDEVQNNEENEQHRKKNNRRKIQLLTSIFLLVFICIVGTMFLTKNTQSIPSARVIATPTPIKVSNKKIVALVSQDQISGWKVYNNKDFSIRYPPDMQIHSSISSDLLGFKNVTMFQLSQVSENGGNDKFYQINFSLVKDTQGLSALDIAKKEILPHSSINKNAVLKTLSTYENNYIDGLYFFDAGKTVAGTPFGINHPVTLYTYAAIIDVMDQRAFLFLIRGNNDGISEEKLRIVDAILSTFSPSPVLSVDKPIDQLISFTLPEGWTSDVKDKDSSYYASENIVIRSPDWDEKNPGLFTGSKTGIILSISKEYGGTVFGRDKEYQDIYDGIHDPDPGGATDQDLTKLTIGGYPAISYYYLFEGYLHTYNIWQGDTIWKITIGAPEEKYRSQLDAFLASIHFIDE